MKKAYVCAILLVFCVVGRQTSPEDFPELLVNGDVTVITQAQPVIAKDLQWDDNAEVKGIRDFVWLMDANNEIVVHEGKKTAYANVFFEGAFGARIYRFESTDGTFTGPEEIVLPREKGIDDQGISIGSVIKQPEGYYMYYAGLVEDSSGVLRYHTYNIAFSEDGLYFERIHTPLTEEDFPGVQHIGLPYTCCAGDSMYMVFESVYDGEYHIYGAYSADGEQFIPLNHGGKVLDNDLVAWAGGGVANPKIFPLQDGSGQFLLGFNGSIPEDPQLWQIAIAMVALDGDNAEIAALPEQPLIAEFEGMKRIESAVLLSDKGLGREIYFFATPTYDATQDAAIYRADIEAFK